MTPIRMQRTGGQLLRYGLVGVGSNLLLYLAYLALAAGGMGYKTAMAMTYWLGVAGTFVFNRNWSFKHKGAWQRSFILYVAVYAVGYLTNLLGLIVLVDFGRLPHQAVQAAMILVVAGLIFILQKFWVFDQRDRGLRSRLTRDRDR